MGDRGNCLNPTVANEDKECEGHASQENAGIKCGNESLVIIIIIFLKIQRHRTQRQKLKSLPKHSTVQVLTLQSW